MHRTISQFWLLLWIVKGIGNKVNKYASVRVIIRNYENYPVYYITQLKFKKLYNVLNCSFLSQSLSLVIKYILLQTFPHIQRYDHNSIQLKPFINFILFTLQACNYLFHFSITLINLFTLIAYYQFLGNIFLLLINRLFLVLHDRLMTV